jgi:carboxymethylenebutenolidase
MKHFTLMLVGILLLGCAAPQEKAGNATKNADMLNESGGLEIETKMVKYYGNTAGFLARPKARGSYPGVILIHEWWGLNDNIKDMAEELASRGYVVLAVDLYDGKVAATAEEARTYVSSVDKDKAIENMRAAVSYLRQGQNAPKVASLGWCFGGGQSMNLALSGERMDATLIYYGNVVTDEEELRTITWPVLGVFGEEDTSIPAERARAFDASLDSIGIENEVHIYPGVGHAFANPSGMNYAPDETKDAWKKTVDFLDRHLK